MVTILLSFLSLLRFHSFLYSVIWICEGFFVFFWVHILTNLLEDSFWYMENFFTNNLSFALFSFCAMNVLHSNYALFLLQLLGKCWYRHFVHSDIVWLLHSVPPYPKTICFFLSVSVWLWVILLCVYYSSIKDLPYSFLFFVALGHFGKGITCEIVNSVSTEINVIFRKTWALTLELS